MTFPLPKSLSWRIGVKLIEQGQMTHADMIAAFDSRPANIQVALSSLIDGNLIVSSAYGYAITDIYKSHINSAVRAPIVPNTGEVAQPRHVGIWDKKVLTGYEAGIRARMRA